MAKDWSFEQYLGFWPMPRGRANIWIDKGDIWREQHNWEKAAHCYRKALQIQPRRQAIWVQLGHAEKEAGNPKAALNAYTEAVRLNEKDSDAALHLGRMAKYAGDMPLARESFRKALKADGSNLDAKRELLTILQNPAAVTPAILKKATVICHEDEAQIEQNFKIETENASFIFDASDLVSYFRTARLPTGIQRVQIGVITKAADCHPLTQVCTFSEENAQWIRIPVKLFQEICALAVASNDMLDPRWTDAMELLAGVQAVGNVVRFSKGSFLVNLGTSWALKNYFLQVRTAKREHHIRYIPFVHDLIPVLAPQFCLRELTQDFLDWIGGVFDHADAFLVNSRSTAHDLSKVAAMLNHEIPADHIKIITLDADIRSNKPCLPLETLDRWGLQPLRFALFVSTIEPRKNHQAALQAWETFIDTYGIDDTPDLVCVGGRGWLNDHVHAMLDQSPALARKVQILSDISDQELALLYEQCCFTLYPSYYEGWGLPVTESLCYGKVPIVATNSSLPEAGGKFAVYIDADKPSTLFSAIDRLWHDVSWRAAKEAQIAEEFTPRLWNDVAVQIEQELVSFSKNLPLRPMPLLTVDYGQLYSMARSRQTRLARRSFNGDMLRQDGGWHPQDDTGCSVRSGGGHIAFKVPDDSKEIRCHLHLQGALGQKSTAIITNGLRSYRIPLAQSQWRWVSICIPVVDQQAWLKLQSDPEIDPNPVKETSLLQQIGVRIAHIVVTPIHGPASPPEIARELAERQDGGAYAFMRAAYPLLVGQELDMAAAQDYLLPLETGSLTRSELVSALAKSQEGIQALDEWLDYY